VCLTPDVETYVADQAIAEAIDKIARTPHATSWQTLRPADNSVVTSASPVVIVIAVGRQADKTEMCR